MAIFLSYSHADSTFADMLAAHLVGAGARIWVDRWELRVGDSIVQRVQDAVGGADAVLVVLSPDSVESEWCKKELATGLVRELEDRRVVVLPILYRDCEIPPFLRDKQYADFRDDFERGLSATLEALAGVLSDGLGRTTETGFYADWAIDWGLSEEGVEFHLTLVSFPKEPDYTVLLQVQLVGNEAATTRYQQFATKGLERLVRLVVLDAVAEGIEGRKLRFVLSDELPQQQTFTLEDPGSRIEYEIIVECRRLGPDNGKDVLFEYGGFFGSIRDTLRARTRPPNREEQQALGELVFGARRMRPGGATEEGESPK